MNGYSNTGFTHTLNGIYSISDGAGTTIEGGEITTSNITTTDLTTINLTLSTFVCSGTATFNGNASFNANIDVSGTFVFGNSSNVNGTTTIDGGKITTKTIITNLIDILPSNTDAYLFPSAVGIYIGSTENTITYIRCYLDCLQFAIFRTGLSAYDTSTFQGITNDFSPLQNNLATDASSLTSTASTIINGGLIIKKNTYAKDMMTDSIATGDIACGNVNSSNGITCPKVICDKINCKTVIAEDVYYKNKICGYINLGIAPYLKIPLTTSLLDTTTSITNFDLSVYLTNANNNTIFLLPYYNVIFYNNDVILTIVDNSAGLDTLFFQNIQFDQPLTCTKILIQYKNMTLL